ncbi:hypothetical protein ABT236_01335 [Streptomyces sp. NPDC001523]|uniref:hypothetical protein n=1 Tax=Streptomyces sp. NPDC001523 TaxID=3154383 RepID=UPI00332C041C
MTFILLTVIPMLLAVLLLRREPGRQRRRRPTVALAPRLDRAAGSRRQHRPALT